MAGKEGHLLQELRRYRAIAIRWLWFLSLSTLLAVAGAYLVSKEIRPVYRATTLLIIDAQGTSDSTYTGLLASDQLVSTYKSLITQPIVLQRAAAHLTNVSAAYIGQRLQISDQPGTQIVVIRVDDTSPTRASAIANAVADAFVAVQQDSADAAYLSSQQQIAQQLAQASQQVSTLSDQIAALQSKDPSDPQIQALQVQLEGAVQNRNALQTLNAQLAAEHISAGGSVRVFQEATPPTAPDHPKASLNALIAGLVGFLIAASLVVVLEFFDDRVHTSEELQVLIGASMLTTIGEAKSGNLLLGTTNTQRNARLSLAFRTLEANLSFIGFDEPLRTIAVTSALPGEGKTTVAVDLAISLTQSGKRVLLIDADMHRPRIHEVLGLSNTGGLSLWLLQSNSPTPIASPAGMPNLHVLTSGPKPPNPSQLLGSTHMRELFRWVMSDQPGIGKVDVVVVDTPPLGAFVDGALVAAMADGAIIVADGSHLRAGPVLRAKETLVRANAKIIGLVLNRAMKHQVAESESYDYIKEYRLKSDDAVAVGALNALSNGNSDHAAIEGAAAQRSNNES